MGKFIDLTGHKFGRLTVIDIETRKNKKIYWKCDCECGNKISVEGYSLRSGHTSSCGCLNLELIKERNERALNDLSNKRFGRIVALEKADSKNRKTYWKCQCDCGNIVVVSKNALIYGDTKSCGCLNRDSLKNRIIPCDYKIIGEVVYVKLRSGEEMICDVDDWNKLKNYGWRKGGTGYASCQIDGKMHKFHIDIMGKRKGFVLDHVNRNRLDNRKKNLRFVTYQLNAINRDKNHNNTSGYKGICWDNARSKWKVQIAVNGKNIHIGRFYNLKDAIKASEDAQNKYHLPLFENL